MPSWLHPIIFTSAVGPTHPAIFCSMTVFAAASPAAPVPLSVGVDWRFRPQYTLSASLGSNIINEWEFIDASGNDIFEEDVDSDVFGSFGISLDF